MGLTLELILKQSHCPLAAEIQVELTLRNSGKDPVETASLFDNNQITNYVLSNDDDKVIGTYNDVTRQLLMEKTEPRFGDFRLIRLAPGTHEQRAQNLGPWHWIDEPGEYYLRGQYRWRDLELVTGPQKLVVERTRLVSLDYQWTYHYGEKYLLNSVWVTKKEDGNYAAYVRQSVRFHPHIVDFNPPVMEQDRHFSPRVSFERTLLAGGPLWVAWIDGADLACLQIVDGRIALGPLRFACELVRLEWVAPPLSARSGELNLFVSGSDQDGTRQVAGLAIDAQGDLVRQCLLGIDVVKATSIRGVPDQDGRYFLLWHTAGEVKSCELDLATLKPVQAPQTVWTTSDAVIDLFTPPVLDEDGLFSCLVNTKRSPRAKIVWLQTTEPGTCVNEEEEAPLPTAGSIVSCEGQMNDAGQVFILFRTDQGIYYVNTAILQCLEIAHRDSADGFAYEHLIVNHRNDVFFGAHQRDRGLKEWLLHEGTQEDLDDLDEEDDEDEDEDEE